MCFVLSFFCLTFAVGSHNKDVFNIFIFFLSCTLWSVDISILLYLFTAINNAVLWATKSFASGYRSLSHPGYNVGSGCDINRQNRSFWSLGFYMKLHIFSYNMFRLF
jgi:hypothetical protein